jgi:predicted nucleotidyltransferase
MSRKKQSRIEILARVKKALSGMEAHLPSIVALGIFGSLARGDFREKSDIDIFLVVEKGEITLEEEIDYRQKLKTSLKELGRDITLMVIPSEAIKKIDNWYILRLAKDAILLFDKGNISSLFQRILIRAREAGLGERKIDGTRVWCIEGKFKPGQVVEVNLNEE